MNRPPYCTLRLACKRHTAVWWYWTANNQPHLTSLTAPKPHQTATPCCHLCATYIWHHTAPNLFDDSQEN